MFVAVKTIGKLEKLKSIVNLFEKKIRSSTCCIILGSRLRPVLMPFL